MKNLLNFMWEINWSWVLGIIIGLAILWLIINLVIKDSPNGSDRHSV